MGRLVMPDGSFAQHSLTYHRLLLDTLVQVECWRRWLHLETLSERFSNRCSAATAWLSAMVDPISGDGPNLGSNDGAFCYQLHSQPYRDFRPTLQLASVLFQCQKALPPGPWDEPLHWLGMVSDGIPAHVDQPELPVPIMLFADGGTSGTACRQQLGLLRLPTYRFRPLPPIHCTLTSGIRE